MNASRFKIIIYVIIMMFSLHTVNIEAQIHNEMGKRYYKVFDIDYLLKDGQLNDEQGSQILSLTKKSYNENDMNYNLRNIWDNIHLIYYDGKYHGEIMLTVFKTYLNRVFADFNNIRVDGPVEKKVIDNFAWDDITYNKRNEYSVDGGYILPYNYRYCFRTIPDISLVASNFSCSDVSGTVKLAKTIENFSNLDLVELRMTDQSRPNENVIANEAAKISSKNIEKAIQEIYQNVDPNDNIFNQNDFDNTLLLIIKPYNITESNYGRTVAKPIYESIVEKVYPFIQNSELKKKFKIKANELGLQFKIKESKSNKIF